jgi:sorting nexin-29
MPVLLLAVVVFLIIQFITRRNKKPDMFHPCLTPDLTLNHSVVPEPSTTARSLLGVDNKLRVEQAGFRAGRGTTEQIFVLRNILEQAIEWNSNLYLCFVDFEKAFNSIHRETLWKIMGSYGIPEKLIIMTKSMYEDSERAVVDGSGTTEWFRVRSGVKQG